MSTSSPDDKRDDDEPERDPTICEACDGYGTISHACQTYEHGCGFSHADSYETPCEHCGGSGKISPEPAPSRDIPPPASPDDDLPF